MLRVGVILDSLHPAAWVAKIIRDIQTSDFAQVQLVLLEQGPAPAASAAGNPDNPGLSLFRWYERWDYRRNRSHQDSLKPTGISEDIGEAPTVPFRCSKEDRVEHVSGDLLERMRQMDVVFRFAPCTLSGPVLGAPRYGIWSFRHDLDFTRRAGKPKGWEALEQNPVSETVLERLQDPEEANRIVDRSYACLERTSLYRSRNPIYWKSSEIALRRLRDLAADGPERVRRSAPHSGLEESPGRAYRRPNNLETLLYFVRYVGRWFRVRTSRQVGPAYKWCIAVRTRSGLRRYDDPEDFRLLVCPEDRFYADPFLFERDGRTFLFFEDFRYAEGRAVISCCELGLDGRPVRPFEVLRLPYHLSYPFVFEDDGEIYMLPETRENRTVELYRATRFPDEWVADTVLMNDVNVVDSTIHKAAGKYWMFASVSDGKYSNCDELSLFFADALRGPWLPHPRNPLLSDVRRARPAGGLFAEDGKLMRPAQDCGKAYGYALVFAEILKMSESEYEERIVSRLNPEVIPHCTATHTYNRTARFEVVDRNLPPAVARESGTTFPQDFPL